MSAPGPRLCGWHDLPDGAARGFDPEATGRDTVFLVRVGEQVFGWRNACPHWEGAPMAWRKDGYLSGDGQHVMCHAHGARFEKSSGLCVLGPCLGRRLEPVPIQVVDGAIHLTKALD